MLFLRAARALIIDRKEWPVAAIPISVTVPNWPENIWAIELSSPRTPDDVRVLMGAMSRCLAPRTPGDCEYAISEADEGVMIRVWRYDCGEARTCTPVRLTAEALADFRIVNGQAGGTLALAGDERCRSESVTIQPMGAGLA
jgi:hypothetical protein